MKKNALTRLSALALLVLCTACPSISPDPHPIKPVPSYILDMEMDTHAAVNDEREAESLSRLVMNETIRKVARAHSQDMIDRDFFGHTSPDGASLGDRLADARVSYARVGENIAWNRGYVNPVTVAVEAWMASPGHRANILRPEFALTGIGIALAPDDACYFTQVFVEPSKSAGMDPVEIYTFGPIAIENP